MFGTFFFIIVGFYSCYYVGMIGYDLYAADKMASAENEAQVVDVSAAASSYKPKDVRSMIEGTDKKTSKPSDLSEADAAGGGRGEFVGSDYQDGYTVADLKAIYAREAQTPSLFAGVRVSI